MSQINQISFISANGFPPDCYQELLAPLNNQFNVNNFLLRPLWTPKQSEKECKTWKLFTDDYITHLDQNNPNKAPIIGIGHSIGATVVLDAALKHPDRFSHLILIEPALFTIKMNLAYMLFRRLGLSHNVHPMINRTKNRHTNFQSKDELIKRLRQKQTFKNITDHTLAIMAESMLEPPDNPSKAKFQLKWTKEWEIEIYDTCCTLDLGIWRNLKSLKIPVLLLIADQSNTFFESTKTRFLRAKPDTHCEVFKNATHLLPFEYPGDCSNKIRGFLEQ